MLQKDTIISLATNAGESALGIIRISGSLCKTLCRDIFDTPCPTARKTILKNYRCLKGKIIDQVILINEQKTVYDDEDEDWQGVI